MERNTATKFPNGGWKDRERGRDREEIMPTQGDDTGDTRADQRGGERKDVGEGRGVRGEV